MQVHFGIELLKPEWHQAVVCIGTFDGVHQGHQQVISAAVAKAKSMEIPVIVVTFDRHPAVILNPPKAPKAIASLKMNLEQLQAHGVGLTVVLPFNAWLSRMSAEEFFQAILIEKLRAACVVVGHDFAMGNGREGNTEWLQQHIETVIVPPFEVDGFRVNWAEPTYYLGEDLKSRDLLTTGKSLEEPSVIQPPTLLVVLTK